MMFNKIYKYSGILFLVYMLVAAIISFAEKYDDLDILALIMAGVLALLNVFLTIFFIRKNNNKSNQEFIKGFFLSTIVRIVILLTIFFTIVLKLPLNHFVFTVGFFILYLLFQIIEIYLLHTNKDLVK